jgi:hypothetical protein
LLVNDTVKLQEDIDSSSVVDLVEYLLITAVSPKTNLRLSTHHMIFHDILSITVAAGALGMEIYADHVHRKCEAQLHTNLPEYEDLNGVVRHANYHPRLLRVTVANLAVRVHEDTVEESRGL